MLFPTNPLIALTKNSIKRINQLTAYFKICTIAHIINIVFIFISFYITNKHLHHNLILLCFFITIATWYTQLRIFRHSRLLNKSLDILHRLCQPHVIERSDYDYELLAIQMNLFRLRINESVLSIVFRVF